MERTELIKTAIAAASPLIASVTEVFVKPKLKKLAEKFPVRKKNFEFLFASKFQDYLMRSYEKYSLINTIVFHNQQKLLKDLYIPLTVYDGKESYKIETFENNFLPRYQRILITDTAGMGKSTLLKRLFLSIVDQKVGIPILIELRRLSNDRDVIDEVLKQISSISEEVDRNFILELIKKGDFIFLFDGYDEISIEEKKIITGQIQTFVNKAGNNLFILTSRPESSLSAFGDFREFKVKGLTIKEAHSLIEKYDYSGKLAKQLIKRLKEHRNESIQEFLTNPLLVSLLFAAFEHKQTIPLKKHIFYRQVYDALFESHDLTKGDSFSRNKFSKLDIDEFHRVLRHLGYNCIIKDKIEFTKDEFLALIKEAKTYTSGLNFKESDLLRDLISTVPLFTIDGVYYKWSHKSLQEYFAAQFIFLDSKESQSQILLKIYRHKNSERFINLFDLYYSIDHKSFSEVVILNLLKDFLQYKSTTYVDFHNPFKDERQILTFGREYVLAHFKFLDDHDNKPHELFARIREHISEDLNGWSLSIAPAPQEDLIGFVKVPQRVKSVARIMQFLFFKKEKFIKLLKENNQSKKIDIQLPENVPYLVNDDRDSILNTDENFSKTNQLILSYDRDNFFYIDEKEAIKTLRKLEQQIAFASNEKLLEF